MNNKMIFCLQGPLETTCGDFWLMVWQQKTRAVVMLNRVIEKGTVSLSLSAVGNCLNIEKYAAAVVSDVTIVFSRQQSEECMQGIGRLGLGC